jgi:hypothetical protein
LLANLVMRRYRKDIPEFWSQQAATACDAADERPELRVLFGQRKALAIAVKGAGKRRR